MRVCVCVAVLCPPLSMWHFVSHILLTFTHCHLSHVFIACLFVCLFFFVYYTNKHTHISHFKNHYIPLSEYSKQFDFPLSFSFLCSLTVYFASVASFSFHSSFEFTTRHQFLPLLLLLLLLLVERERTAK